MRSITIKKDEVKFAKKPAHGQFHDLTNEIFNRLKVVGYAGKFSSGNSWWCECSCGNENFIRTCIGALRSGATQSCGCLHSERSKESHTTHGLEDSPEYNSYRGIIERCKNTNSKNYKRYGERGIECKFNSFEDFYKEVGERPHPKHLFSIERINNDGHYEVGNVEWATRKKQANNTRQTRKITYNGELKTYAGWAEKTGLPHRLIYKRIWKGWCIECALTLPRQNISNTCRHKGEN